MTQTATRSVFVFLCFMTAFACADDAGLPSHGLILRLSADDIDADGKADSLPGGQVVDKWRDRSGLGNDVTQSDAKLRPKLEIAADGTKHLRFDGEDALELPRVSGLQAGDQPFHVFFVMRAAMTPKQANPRLLDLRGDDGKEARRGFWIGYQGNGRNRLGLTNGDEAQAASVAWDNARHLVEVVYEGGQRWAHFLDGNSDGRGVYQSRTFLGLRKDIRLAIGQHSQLRQPNTYFNGTLGAVLIYNRVLSPDEQNQVGAHLAKKFALDTEYGPVPHFERDVRLVLEQRCFICHGKEKQEGGVDLRTVTAMLRGGDGGPIVVRGRPEHSVLLDVIQSGEMPPKDAKNTSAPGLDDDQIKLISRWIERGLHEIEDIIEEDAERDSGGVWEPSDPKLPVPGGMA